MGTFHPITDALPIFRQDDPTGAVFYAPGYLAVVNANHAAAFEQAVTVGIGEGITAEMRHYATTAQQQWQTLYERPYAPVCLTIYLNNVCHLACSYCFSMPASRNLPTVSLEAVQAAAVVVADHCQAQRRPFTVVCHGGGEPTLDYRLAGAILDTAEQAAAERGLGMFRYIATNGVMSTRRAQWVAQRFDLIGLSCDGSPDIQARQRPIRGGASSAPFVEQTARVIREAGKGLHVRVTVTAETLHRQSHIAEYICAVLQPQEIHVEPVYRLGRATSEAFVALDNAEAFVSEFLQAQAVAQCYGVPWMTSGSRPETIHSAYCQVFRDVLHIVPGDVATACFATSSAAEASQQGSVIAQYQSRSFTLNGEYIASVRRKLVADPSECMTCFNRYHCARGCPEYCPLSGAAFVPGFRCRVQQLLTQTRLATVAAALRASPTYHANRVAGTPIH